MEELIGVIVKKILDDEVREGRLEYIKESREKAEMLEYHFENDYPEKLLRSQHPSEEPWMKAGAEFLWRPESARGSIEDDMDESSERGLC